MAGATGLEPAASCVTGRRCAREIIDEYLNKGIFYRGYIFVCENCSDAAWHSISDVDQTFTCRRCGLNQQYKYTNWKYPNEPSWFYKLDEMIYLMLENNGHVPLLTLNKLRLQSKESFLFRPEVCITAKDSAKAYLELDICCIANGLLCIGEAKSKNSLASQELTVKETAERYHWLALKMEHQWSRSVRQNRSGVRQAETRFAWRSQMTLIVNVRIFRADDLYN